MAKLTIITPVYNAEKYLHRCMESILNQTFTDFELILINDGSTDRSGELCDEYAQRDSRVKVLHQKNQGQAVARNNALDIACGEFIGFVDSDDYIHPQMYEILVKNATKHDAQVSVGGYKNVQQDLTDSKIYDVVKTSIYDGKSFLQHCLLDSVDKKCWVLWDKIYKKTCFNKIRIPEGRIYEDNAVVYKLLYGAETVVDCDIPLYYYYQNDESTTHKAFSVKTLDWLKVLNEMIEFFTKNKEPLLLDKISHQYFFALVDMKKKARVHIKDKNIDIRLKKELKRLYSIERKKYPISIKTHPDIWNEMYPLRSKLYWTLQGIKKKFMRR